MSADLCFTTDSFFLCSFLFVSYSPSSLNGTQRKSATWSEVSAIRKRMSKFWGIPSPNKSRVQNDLFWTTSQLNGNFNGLYLRNETWYTQGGKCFANYKGVSHIVSKGHELRCTNGFKLEVSFHPSSVNSAFHFIARLRSRRSANGTQPNFAKRWTVNRANNPP